MLSSLWIIWGVGALIMVAGVALVSSRRPRHHHVWGVCLFGFGFIVALIAICLILVSPVR